MDGGADGTNFSLLWGSRSSVIKDRKIQKKFKSASVTGYKWSHKL